MNRLEQEIIKYCKKEVPNEACGFIAEGKFCPCKNLSNDPKETFVIAQNDWQDNAQIIVHSHPNGEPYLSGADRMAQHRSCLEWWLVTNGKINKYRYAPLLKGRVFEYGKADCCAIIEDAYMLMGIFSTQFPRLDVKADKENLSIIQYMQEAGFDIVSEQEDGLQKAMPGDVILTSVRGVANHASLYLGDEQVLHHPMGGLSRVEMLGEVWHKIVHSVWRHSQFKPEMMQAIRNDLEATW
ncbi:MAG: C40 family peptidase [Gammaproteobacteria bacterium]|nr:C40 family peptidase [Gammaproteobacteria bacterium]